MAGCVTRGGRFQYTFKALDSLAIMFVEVKLKIASNATRDKAIAQVIAGCDGELYFQVRYYLVIQIYSYSLRLEQQDLEKQPQLALGWNWHTSIWYFMRWD
jgi:hypothetical protein